MAAYSHTPLSDSSENCLFLILKPEAFKNTPWEPELRNMITTPFYSDSESTKGSRVLRGLIVETPLSVAAERGFFALSAPLYSPNPTLTNTMACFVNITGF